MFQGPSREYTSHPSKRDLSLICNECIPVLISYHLFFYTIQVSIMRISHFLIPVGYGYLTVYLFSIPIGSIYHARVFIPRQNILVSIWSGMVLTQIITRVYEDSLTLTYPPNINIWLVLQFWYLQVGCLIPLLTPCIHINTRPTMVYTMDDLGVVRISYRRGCTYMVESLGISRSHAGTPP